MNILKRAILSCAFVCALAVSGFAQSADDNTITGNVYDAFNNPLVGFSFTVTVTRRDGVAVSSAPKTVTTITAGALPSTFQLPRRSFVTFRGGFTIGRYNFTNGVSLFVPDESTTSIYNLKSVEDAAAALVEVAAAPSDAQYIVGTANGTLSAEQSLGALTTGLLKNTVSGSTGTLSTAVAADLPLISTLTADATPDSAADYVLTYDASAGVHKKVLLSNLPSSGGGGTWGSITGTLSSQTDLQSALDLKANLISPSFTTPTLGVASATSINKLAITTPATGSTLAIADGKTFTASNTITLTATDGSTLAIGAGGTLGSAAYTASSAYEVPLTFSTGLTRSTNTITVNTSQNIATLSNLTSNGIVTTSGGGGTLGVTVPGTGVLTALGVNVGSAGAFVVNGGALGTPSSGTLTSATGLPISTGVSGLGTGIAAFLATPSSANLASALTDETGGSGLAVFNSTPTIITPSFTTGFTIGGVAATGTIPRGNGTNFVASAYTMAAPGTSGNVLTSDGTNWLSAAPAGGGGTPGGSDTQLQYNNAGSFGGIPGATTNGTNLTTTSGVLRATSPRITTSIFDTNGLAIISLNPTASAVNSLQVTNGATGSPGVVDLAAIGSDSNVRLTLTPKGTAGVVITDASANGLVVGPNGTTGASFTVATNTASAASGITVTGKADGTAPSVVVNSRSQQTASVAGNGLNITADPAIAGSSSAGAAAGGSVTITAGAAARLTSGNAAGGSISLTPGAGIGTGAAGSVVVNISSGSVANGGLRIGSSGANTGFWETGSYFGVDVGGSNAGGWRGTYGWTTGYHGLGSSTPDVSINRVGAGVMRIGQGATAPTAAGSLVLGTSTVGSIGTSGVGVLAIANGTAPGSSPADEFQLYSADSAAGDANAWIRNEAGEVNRLTGLAARNSSSFAKTTDTTLANITGLTRNVEAGRTYAFTATMQTTAAATGGVKFAVSGTATATSISYEGILVDTGVGVAQTRATALDTTVCASTTSTAGTCTIKGVVVINSGGTLTLQFAQNASDGGASTVLVNQYFQLIPIS